MGGGGGSVWGKGVKWEVVLMCLEVQTLCWRG